MLLSGTAAVEVTFPVYHLGEILVSSGPPPPPLVHAVGVQFIWHQFVFRGCQEEVCRHPAALRAPLSIFSLYFLQFSSGVLSWRFLCRHLAISWCWKLEACSWTQGLPFSRLPAARVKNISGHFFSANKLRKNPKNGLWKEFQKNCDVF